MFAMRRFSTLALSALCLLLLLPQGSDAFLGLFFAGLNTASFTVTVFSGSFYFGQMLTMGVWFISLANVHRQDSERDQYYTHTLHGVVAILLGGLLAKLLISLFYFPMLVKTQDAYTVRKKCCETTRNTWTFIPLPLAAFFGLSAYFILRGFADSIWRQSQSLAFGIVFVVAAIALIGAAVWMLWRTNQRFTLKHLVAMVIYLLPPFFFDTNVFGISVLSRGFLLTGFYTVLGIIYFFYAQAWRDPYFFGRATHALWFSLFLSASQSIVYLAQAIVNSRTDSILAAFVGHVVGTAIVVILYLIIYVTGLYGGYACRVDDSKDNTIHIACGDPNPCKTRARS